MKRKIVLLPCSGIGKAYGEIGRQAIYELLADEPSEGITTTCLARLMIDDPETKNLVGDNLVISVDGCARDCARKNVEACGKPVDRSLRVIEIFKDHQELRPKGILDLGEEGFQLVHILARRLKEEIEQLTRKEGYAND